MLIMTLNTEDYTMAKVYAAPIDPPVFKYETWKEDEAAYLEKLVAQAKKESPNDNLAGEEVSWPRADGYARYMVWSSKPLKLIHLKLGDAWEVEDALLRGLLVSDVMTMVDRRKRIAALFNRP